MALKFNPHHREYKKVIVIKVKDVDVGRMEADLRIPKKWIKSAIKHFEEKYFDEALDCYYRARTDAEKEAAIVKLAKFYIKESPV